MPRPTAVNFPKALVIRSWATTLSPPHIRSNNHSRAVGETHLPSGENTVGSVVNDAKTVQLFSLGVPSVPSLRVARI